MNKKTAIGLTLLTTFTHESVARSTSTASRPDQERQHVEPERKQMFDSSNPVSKAKKGAIPNLASIDQEMCRVDRGRRQMLDPNNPTAKNAIDMFPNVPTPERAGVDIETLARRYEQEVQTRKMDGLMIFTSFTVPAESLKRIVSQAN